MEPKNYKIVKNFVSKDEVNLITNWISTIEHNGSDSNYHLTEISKSLKGKSCIFDISKTEITKYITKFQSVSNVSQDSLPDFITNILERISNKFQLPKEHIFLQAVDMNKGGRIDPHYDASLPGFINYKCNLSILSENYNIYIGEQSVEIEETDLYCFEASLYKHWTDEFNSRRVFLSFGFMVPYSILSRKNDDPRVRLSERIQKYFQNI